MSFYQTLLRSVNRPAHNGFAEDEKWIPTIEKDFIFCFSIYLPYGDGQLSHFFEHFSSS